jgi:tyrosyl-tRNA synthetase
MEIEDRFNLIKRNTVEIITEQEMLELLRTKKQPAVYLGTAITGRPHVGYFMWVLKMADFLKAGFRVKVLLADFHGALDRTPWELLEKRFQYYSLVIPAMFESVGADIGNFEIVKGSDFEKKPEYFLDLLRVATVASIHDCTKASSEVVKQEENPKLSGLVYPIMQMLDEQYLDCDVQYGGLDQRKIFMFARENHPKIGYKPRVEVMTPLIPGLIGKKMSASDEESKIDLLDSPERVKQKLNKAFCPEGEIEENGVLAFTKYVIFTIKGDRSEEFVIKRPEKWGGNLVYKDYGSLERDFAEKRLHPQDLKSAVADEINALLEPIRKKAEGQEKLVADAYPK